jgi:hypothetical protein
MVTRSFEAWEIPLGALFLSIGVFILVRPEKVRAVAIGLYRRFPWLFAKNAIARWQSPSTLISMRLGAVGLILMGLVYFWAAMIQPH